MAFKQTIFSKYVNGTRDPPSFMANVILNFQFVNISL